MSIFKNTLITCKNCKGKIMVKPSDFERGMVQCTHNNCTHTNNLENDYCFDENIINSLPEFGKLINNRTHLDFSMQFGKNIIGTSELATIHLNRELFTHNGKCFISRQHCTLEIKFDQWSGKLRYVLHDGFYNIQEKIYNSSSNGTFLNDLRLKKSEIIDIQNGDVITLGGLDKFRLKIYDIPLSVLEQNRITLDFDLDRTQ